MAVTFPAQRRHDLAELTPAQLEALYAECDNLRDRLTGIPEVHELLPLRAALDRVLATVYRRLGPSPDPVVSLARTVYCDGGPSDAPACRQTFVVSSRAAADRELDAAGWTWHDELNYCPAHALSESELRALDGDR